MVEPGRVIGARYRVLEPLGKGGMGTTYAAEDIKTGQQVALKTLSLESLDNWKALELFKREARVLKSIDHPGVPAYIDDVSDGEDDVFYLVQERVNGASLAQKMEAGWRPDESEVKRIARGVLDVLCYLHGRYPWIIHRDITPRNVLLREDGRVALVDFGAVKDRPQTEDSFASTVVGTYGYMAPEQLQSNAVPASDLYGLGTTLAFVLTGHPPSKLPKKRLKIHIGELALISEPFRNWLDRLLEPIPEDRFDSARDALHALERASSVQASPPIPSKPGLQPPVDRIRPLPAGSRIVERSDENAFDVILPPVSIRAFMFMLGFIFILFIYFLSIMDISFFTLNHGLALVVPTITGVWFIWLISERMISNQRFRLEEKFVLLENKIYNYTTHSYKMLTKDVEYVTVHTPNVGNGQHIRIKVRGEVYRLGEHLSEAENRWLVERIESYRQAFASTELPEGPKASSQRNTSRLPKSQKEQLGAVQEVRSKR